jgi:hypothetical protein
VSDQQRPWQKPPDPVNQGIAASQLPVPCKTIANRAEISQTSVHWPHKAPNILKPAHLPTTPTDALFSGFFGLLRVLSVFSNPMSLCRLVW